MAVTLNLKPGVIIAILEGEHGNGIELVGPVHSTVPDFLEALAKDLRKQAAEDALKLQASGGLSYDERNPGHRPPRN